jgi:spore coat polysaccharide biosynthesis protein SpsF
MKDNPKTVALVQARMGSSRLPGKMMMDLCGYPVLHWVLYRVKQAQRLDDVVLATTQRNQDDPLVRLAGNLSVSSFRGSEADVLGRFAEAARVTGCHLVVRVCADNPLIAWEEIDRLVDFYSALLNQDADPDRLYAFNHLPRLGNRYADGLGAEIFSQKLLQNLANLAVAPLHREHVTTYLWEHAADYDIHAVPAPPEVAYPEVKLDVDTPEDLERLRMLCARLSLQSSARDIVLAFRKQFGLC